MDATQDAARERAGEDLRLDADNVIGVPQDDTREVTIRRLSWMLVWGVALIALIVGISLTSTGSIEQWTPVGDDTYDVTMLAVWPAGLVLLGVGALGVLAAALTWAVLATKR